MVDNESIKAKEILKTKDIKLENGVTYATGAGAFADLFNGLVDEVVEKAQKEADKPKYRFLDTSNNKYEDLVSGSSITFGEIQQLQENLADLNYVVEIYEDLDCKDVTNDSRYFIRISNNNGVYININLFDYQTKIKDFTFNEQDYIENEISKIVGYSNRETKEIASYAVDYIAHIMYFRDLYTLTYKRIGWDFYNWNRKTWLFKYDKIYAGNNLLFNGRLSNSLAEGLQEVEDDFHNKEFEWVLHTKKLINKHSYVALILGAGISGLIRQLLPFTKETNLNINIVGKPASGKSTICHYLLSVFGDPKKLEGSFIDTDNKMEENRGKRPILPYVLDERMLKVVTESEKSKQQTVLMDIFREYEGKVKERLGKQYEETSGERTYGPIISSSVESMMKYVFKNDDLGQYRRFIEFNIGKQSDHLLFSNTEEAKETGTIASSNYGFGVRLIVEYMFTLLNVYNEENEIDNEPTFIRKRFNAVDKVINTLLKDREAEEREKSKAIGKECKAVDMSSSSERFALIVLSYQIFREALLYYDFLKFNVEKITIEGLVGKAKDIKELVEKAKSFDEYIDSDLIIEDKSAEVVQILIDNLVDKLNKVERDPQEKVNRLYDYVIKYREDFLEGTKFEVEDIKELLNSNGDKLGFCIIDESKGNIKLYTIYNYALPQFWEMEEIPEPAIIKKFIKEVIKQGYTASKSVKYGNDKYGTIEIRDISSKEKYGYNNKTVNKKPVTFHEMNIQYTKVKKDEE